MTVKIGRKDLLKFAVAGFMLAMCWALSADPLSGPRLKIRGIQAQIRAKVRRALPSVIE